MTEDTSGSRNAEGSTGPRSDGTTPATHKPNDATTGDEATDNKATGDKATESAAEREARLEKRREAAREKRRAERAEANRAQPGQKPGGQGGPGGKGGKGAKGPGGAKKGKPNETPAPVVVRPMAEPAKRRGRHVGVILSFFLLTVLPTLGVAWYMYERAVDQYGTDLGFTVRQEDDSGGVAALAGGLAALTGASAVGGAADSDILYEYLRSASLVRSLNAELDLWSHYSAVYDQDPVFGLKPGGTIEDLSDYWQRIATIDYDSTTGLIDINVRAFDAAFSKALAEKVLNDAQDLVNELNAQSREDTLRYAEADLAESLERLRAAREAMVEYRTRTQIVDPEADMETRLGVQMSLQQQLAQAFIEYDMMAPTASEGDPRVAQAQRRIDVIQERIREERESFAAEEDAHGGEGYPNLIAEYESLVVDREFAEQMYRAALVQRDTALAQATRRSRYLATYISPSLAETAEFPKRNQVIFVTFLFLSLAWMLGVLIYYSVRDRN